MAKNIIVTALISVVASVIVVLGISYLTQKPVLGGASGGMLAENYIPYIQYNGGYNSAKSIKTTADLTVGSSGSTVSQIQKGTCALVGSDVSVTATTSKAFDCAVTGVVSGDIVQVQLGTSTPTAPQGGWVVIGSQASSTSGFITMILLNLTGANATPSVTSVGSSTSYEIFR